MGQYRYLQYRNIDINGHFNILEPVNENSTSAEYLLIDESKYRKDDILDVTIQFMWRTEDDVFIKYHSEKITPNDNTNAQKKLEKQGELLQKYLGISIIINDKVSDEINFDYCINWKLVNNHTYIHFRCCGDPCKYNCHKDVEITSQDMPALVHACNKMLSEYIVWCEENGEDVYNALILPCRKTPNYYYYQPHSMCYNFGNLLQDLLLPDRLVDEWNTMEDRVNRSQLQMKAREIYERGELIVTFYGSCRINSEITTLNVLVPGIAWIYIHFYCGNIIVPDIYGIISGRCENVIGSFPIADSYPSSLNVFCELPPEVINYVLKESIFKYENEFGIHSDTYRICGTMKLKDNIPTYTYRRMYSYAPDAYEARRLMIQEGGVLSPNDNLYFYRGLFDVAKIYLRENENWDVSEIEEYSERMHVFDDKYCAERYGWKSDSKAFIVKG